MLEIQIITPNVSIRIVQKYELNIMFNTRLKMEKMVTYFESVFSIVRVFCSVRKKNFNVDFI